MLWDDLHTLQLQHSAEHQQAPRSRLSGHHMDSFDRIAPPPWLNMMKDVEVPIWVPRGLFLPL